MPFLDWVNKNQAKQVAADVPYRMLDFREQFGEPNAPGAGDNLLIQGDNLLALKALIPFYAGRVKCIFIDPPYNTQSAFEHYDDKLEHSQWLSMMYPRLGLLRDLLSEDGSIWVTIDENEGHYLKVLMDEVFGRNRFIATNVWQKRYSRENRGAIGDAHDYVLTYAYSPDRFKETRNRVPMSEEQAKVYKNPNDDPRGRWRAIPMTAQGFRPNQMYEIEAPGGTTHRPPDGRCWSMVEPEYKKLLEAGRIYFGRDKNSQPGVIRYLDEVEGIVPWTWWPHEDAGHTDEAKKEANEIFGGDVSFGTPKPERLMQRIIQIASNEGDIVLDSFLGSGTTAAVAHKMGRRYVGIEEGDHARSHCIPRLRKVIEGERGGISEAVDWKGGGGFRFYTLGEPVFLADGGINPAVRFKALASYVWHFETGQPAKKNFKLPYLGGHEDIAYYLLYNGILGDKTPQGGNVLTQAVLSYLREKTPKPHPSLPRPMKKMVIYGEKTLLSTQRLAAEGIVFKQIPYDIKAR